jgi:small subunit ribosomal protein S14
VIEDLNKRRFKLPNYPITKLQNWQESSLATTAKRVKDAKKPKFSTRKHNRCKICGRPRAYLRKFGICRLCFRGLALRGEIPGVSKSSW